MNKELEIQIEKRKRVFLPGATVKCVKLEDEYLKFDLTQAVGCVRNVDDTGTVFVNWVKTEDNGEIHTSSLGAVLGVDEIELVESAKVYLCVTVKRGAPMKTRKCFVLSKEDFAQRYADIYKEDKNAYINISSNENSLFSMTTTCLDKSQSNVYKEFIENEYQNIDISMCTDYFSHFIQEDIDKAKKGEWA